MAKEFASNQEIINFLNGKTDASRTDLIEFERSSGKWVPKEVWTNKIGRGQYSLVSLTEAVEPITTQQVAIDTVSEKTVVAREVAKIHREPEQPKMSDLVSREVDVFDRDSLIPAVNPDYVPWGNYRDVNALIKSNQFFTLYITGDSGTGKNAMIEQVCAKNKRPMIRVNITRETKEEHLIGSKTLIDGNIVYEDGPVIWAALNGGILVLDEISLADVNEIMTLQNVMEGGEFFVKSLNRVIKPVQGFAIIASDNTKGQGSDNGRFIGTNVLNSAFLDRFDMMMVQDYPPLNIELQIMTKAYARYSADVDTDFISSICNWVQIIRRTYQQEALDDLISTRRAIKIIKARALWFNAAKAIDYGVTRFDDTTADAFKTLWEKLQTGEIVNQVVPPADDVVVAED